MSVRKIRLSFSDELRVRIGLEPLETKAKEHPQKAFEKSFSQVSTIWERLIELSLMEEKISLQKNGEQFDDVDEFEDTKRAAYQLLSLSLFELERALKLLDEE